MPKVNIPEKSRQEQIEEIEANGEMVNEEDSQTVWFGGHGKGEMAKFLDTWQFKAFGGHVQKRKGSQSTKDSEGDDQMNVDK